MSALDLVPHDTAPVGPARTRVEPLRILLRLTLLEARRSPLPFMLPLVAALFWFDALRTGDGLPATWVQRASILPDHVLPDLGPIVAGMSAWVGSREKRRGMADLTESTARPRWLRQLAACGGTLAWTLSAYAVAVAVIYILAARVITWGGPPIWPIVVAGLGVALFCTAGFVAGALFPGRFTAPLAAIGSLFVSVMVYQTNVREGGGWSTLSPNGPLPPLDWGVFHPVPPDLPIVQTVFLLGAVALLLGIMGLWSALHSRQLLRTTSAVTLVGAALCTAALSVANTVTLADHGYVAPLLHDAAGDHPFSYTPVCSQGTAIPVCIHPVFSNDLTTAENTLNPVLSEVAGLPGAPARATQIDSHELPETGVALVGTASGAPVLEYAFDDQSVVTQPGVSGALRAQAATVVLASVIAPSGDPNLAQQAVEAALFQAIGVPAPPKTSIAPSAVQAAHRFAGLSSAERHTWLAAHIDQLGAGRISLEELP